MIYPGLKSHPNYKVAKKQMRLPGAIVTFYIKGGCKETEKMLTSMEIITLAESLGGVESLIQSPPLMTHYGLSPETKKELGLSENQVRLSVGIENVDDLI